MIDRRRCTRPTPASRQKPSASGPRCAMLSPIAFKSVCSGVRAGSAYTMPAIPHMEGLSTAKPQAAADYRCGYADRDGVIGDRLGHHGPRADDAMLAHVRQHHRPVADPRILADRNPRPDAGLLADRDVQ